MGWLAKWSQTTKTRIQVLVSQVTDNGQPHSPWLKDTLIPQQFGADCMHQNAINYSDDLCCLTLSLCSLSHTHKNVTGHSAYIIHNTIFTIIHSLSHIAKLWCNKIQRTWLISEGKFSVNDRIEQLRYTHYSHVIVVHKHLLAFALLPAAPFQTPRWSYWVYVIISNPLEHFLCSCLVSPVAEVTVWYCTGDET